MSTKLLQYILGIVYVTLVVGTNSEEKGEFRVAHKLIGGHLAVYDIKDSTELVTSSAGAGRDSKKKKNEEEKKTLSQQVADGKYGLIQTELFSKPIKRPGIISYKDNNEVPNDNMKNLGGLNKNDIWLSENHLLVIRGGTYPPHTERPAANATAIWPPIDDYRAPQRQVKIPKHPKVPPPFPVQLTENGPLLLLGTNSSTTLNGTFGSELYPLYPPENYISEDGGPINEPPYSYPTNVTPGEAPFPISPYPPNDFGGYNTSERLNDTLLPFFGPGALLPPLENLTNLYDDDDTSIYYPPPYSFYYPKDNSSRVPPGPLVPGIVLPPPPDFFASEDEPTTIATTKFTEATTPDSEFNQVNSTVGPEVKPTRTTEQAPTYPTVTVLKSTNYDQDNRQRPFKTYSPPSSTVINTTQVPLKTYYTTTYKLVTQKPNRTYLPSGLSNTKFRKQTTKPPAQYYLYEENNINTTPKQYYNNPRDSDILVQQINPPRQFPETPNTQYYYINGENIFNNYQTKPPTKKSDTFSIHIARLRDQIHSSHYIQQQPPQNKNYYSPQAPAPKPVYQYSFQAANYPNQHKTYQSPLEHYQVEIEEAVEVTTPVYDTPQENFYYQNPVTQNPVRYREDYSKFNYAVPKTISQFSFEATPNPIYQQFYTKQEEKYIDDVTKQHFTVFGKKLPAITTPIPPSAGLSEYIQQPRPVELEQDDTIIDYLPPPQPQQYYNIDYRAAQPVRGNYALQPQRQPANSNLRFSEPQYANEERKPYVSYELPGDRGTHFYFITPQLAQKRQQNSSFYFSRSNATGLRDGENTRFK